MGGFLWLESISSFAWVHESSLFYITVYAASMWVPWNCQEKYTIQGKLTIINYGLT